MKNIILTFTVLLAFFALSCKKNHVCECKTFENGVINGNKNSNTSFTEMNKQDAIKECNKMDTTATTVQGITVLTQCEIK